MAMFSSKKAWLLPGLLPALAGCTLTLTEPIEPALPRGRVDGTSTLAYHADGLPVVANYVPQLFAFFGPSVGATLSPRDTSLVIHASDAGQQPGNYPQHYLELKIRKFRGVGTYQLEAANPYGAASYYQVRTYDPAWQGYRDGPELNLVPGGKRQLTITQWLPQQQVSGTFELDVADPRAPQVVTRLRDGWLDIVDVK